MIKAKHGQFLTRMPMWQNVLDDISQVRW